MAQLTASIVRLACNQSSRDSVSNKLYSGQMTFWKNSALRVQCAVFAADPSKETNFIDDIGNYTDAQFVAREGDAEGTVMLNATVLAAAMDGGLAYGEWSADDGQHFEFAFDNTAMNFALAPGKSLYIAIGVNLVDGSFVPVATGLVQFRDPGIGSAGAPTAPDYTSWSKAESDARYLAIASDLDAFTGGATALDALATTTRTLGAIMPVVESGEGVLSWWRLRAGADAEDSAGGVVRPDDYAAATNERVWERVG